MEDRKVERRAEGSPSPMVRLMAENNILLIFDKESYEE